MKQTLSGSCVCQSIQFSTTGHARDIIACHCKECRKSSGHYSAATAVEPKHLSITDNGSLKWYRASDSAQRGFCSNCGSSLFWKPDSGDRISIYAGSLDNTGGLTITNHIYVAEKGNYYTIDNTMPCFEQGGAELKIPK